MRVLGIDRKSCKPVKKVWMLVTCNVMNNHAAYSRVRNKMKIVQSPYSKESFISGLLPQISCKLGSIV
jgi:hypothetical protein